MNEPAPNFVEVMESFSKWVNRLEDKDNEWVEQDWKNWAVDITDAIIDIYAYFKSIGLLAHGLDKILYKPKKENSIEEEIVKKSIETLFI